MVVRMAQDKKDTCLLSVALQPPERLCAGLQPSQLCVRGRAGRVLLLPVAGVHVSACRAQTGTVLYLPASLPCSGRLWTPAFERRLPVTVLRVWAGSLSHLFDKQQLISASVSQPAACPCMLMLISFNKHRNTRASLPLCACEAAREPGMRGHGRRKSERKCASS